MAFTIICIHPIVGCKYLKILKEEEYYCCYRKTSDGGLKYYKFKMSDTTVYETLKNGEQAYVEKITDGFGELLGYKLYVPENTIVQEIDLSIVK